MKPKCGWSRGFCQANVLSIKDRFLVPGDDIYFFCDIYFSNTLRIDRFERPKIQFICKSFSLLLDPDPDLYSQYGSGSGSKGANSMWIHADLDPKQLCTLLYRYSGTN
jgi:hypothetical protein